MVSCQGAARAFCGSAQYDRDPDLGNVLRVRVDQPHDSENAVGTTELIIAEREWDGEIVPDNEYGCDFCFRPSPSWPPG